MIRKFAPCLILCALGATGPMGCIGNHADPLDSRMFIAPSFGQAAPIPSRSYDVADTSQPLPSLRVNPETASVLPDPAAPKSRPFDAIEPIGELTSSAATQPSIVQSSESVAPVAVPAASLQMPVVVPATQPSVPQAHYRGPSSGVYMTMGGVMAIVDGNPIYTCEVLAPLKKRFSVKAHELDARQFERYAAQEIALQLRERIDSERRFAEAYHSLSDDDRKLSDAIAMMIRKERVTAAGGSVEEARRIAAETGEDFETSLKQAYRLEVIELNQERHRAMVVVSADAMRDFYRQNLDKLYGTKAQAQYRVIEIDADKCSNLAAARERADGIRDKAVHGADFAALASADNDDDFLKSRGGSPMYPGQWMEKNTFMVDAVDAAVWELQPGQVTPVIDVKGKLYVAKMEARRGGTVRPFEDLSVQADIYEKVWRLQGTRLDEEMSAIASPWDTIVSDEKRFEVAVDIAMQQYARAQIADASTVSSTGH